MWALYSLCELDMANEIVFVGAGPIGLWTAIQIKLQRPDIEIVFKEKHVEYQRTHTLLLKTKAFEDCVKDDSGVIDQIITQLQSNPHIRTDVLETSLLDLAKQLGINIEYQKVEDIGADVLPDYPDAAMVIGSDGVRSQVRTQIFGEDNVQKTPLAYACQLKYFVKGDAVQENKLFETYPLLKQSNYLAFVNVGKKNEEGYTPVTVQHFIDKETYEKLKGKATFAHPIKLFSDDIDEQLPPELLADVKTQIGFRLANGEDILVDSVKLTVNELPQQRCNQTTLLKDGTFFGLIGDAALALSYFKGMNTGLKLATRFAKYIADHWDQILGKEPDVFADYEEFYDTFAETALADGIKTNKSVKALESAITSSRYLPFQFLYFSNNQIADFHRQFDILHQASQFYLETQLVADRKQATAHIVQTWLEDQMPQGLILLKQRTKQRALRNVHNPELHDALLKLAELNTDDMSLHEKAYYGLALSKTCDLLDDPGSVQEQKFVRFMGQLKNVKSSASLMISSILFAIAGIVLVGVSIASAVATPASVAAFTVGSALLAHGLYKLHQNVQSQDATYKAIREIKDIVMPEDEGSSPSFVFS